MSLSITQINTIRARAECLHDAAAVQLAFDRMGAAISHELAATRPVVLCVLNGGIIPAGQLLLRLDFPLETGYLHATRYRNGTRGGDMQWLCKPAIALQGRTVLVIDDILDEGNTLRDILAFCEQAGASKTWSAVLVQKQRHHGTAATHADFVGLQVADRYVFGCGMDYRGYLRNVNGVFAVSEQDLA